MTSTTRVHTHACSTCGIPIAPLQSTTTVGTMPPRQWVDTNNNVASFVPKRHEHSPQPLCECGHTAEQQTGAGRCWQWRCTCAAHPAPEWAPDPFSPNWIALGRQAFHLGAMRAPAMNSVVMNAIAGMAVGTGATEIMERFCRGWDEANLAQDI